MLRDMEELVLSVKKQNIREYMIEAKNCYNVGSYRACIILTTIAGMHDLREKIKNLSSSIREIRDLDNEIQSRLDNEDNYENYMVEQAASLAILSTAEVESIKSYNVLRNRCAHPNEYVATAEEARMVFSGYIDNVINKPSLLGPAYIQVIISRLENEMFFPEYTIDKVKIIVMEEIRSLHRSAILPLVKKLISVLEDQSLRRTTKWMNSTFFLAGILDETTDGEIIKSISEKLSRLIENEDLFNSVLVSAISFPKLLNYLNLTDKERFLAHLKTSISSTMNIIQLEIINTLITQGLLTELEQNQVLNVFNTEIEKSHKIISDSTDRSSVDELSNWTNKVEALNILQVDNSFFNTLIKLINDNDYSVVNQAITMLNELEKDLFNRMDSQQLSELFITIIKQAHGPGRGADEARKLWQDMFKDYKEHFSKFIEYTTTDYSGYNNFNRKIGSDNLGYIYIIEILEELNSHNLLKNVIGFIKERFNDEPDFLEIELRELKRIIGVVGKTEWDAIVSEIDSTLKIMRTKIDSV